MERRNCKTVKSGFVVWNTEKTESYCISYIIAYLFVQALNLFVKTVLTSFPYWSLISKGFLAFFMVRALVVIVEKHFFPFALTECLVLCFFGYTYVLGEYSYQSLLKTLFDTVAVFIPLAFSVVCITDWREFLKRLYAFSWPVNVVLMATWMGQTFSTYNYNMPMSYAILLQMLIVIDHFFEERKWYDLVTSIVLFFSIVLGGARGPLLCTAVYVCLRFAEARNIRLQTKSLVILSVLVAVILLLIFLDDILVFLIAELKRYGISSRTLTMMLNKNFSDSGRSKIYIRYIEKTRNAPALGFGFTGGWENSEYPHNIFLEFFMSFGHVVGSLFSVIYVSSIVQGLIMRDCRRQRLALIFISYCVSLLVSNSFLLEPLFFVTMPICLESIVPEFHVCEKRVKAN